MLFVKRGCLELSTGELLLSSSRLLSLDTLGTPDGISCDVWLCNSFEQILLLRLILRLDHLCEYV